MTALKNFKDKLILKHTQKYWDIYEHALMSNDFTNARQSLNDLAKLQGLNEPDKVHITGTSIKLNIGTIIFSPFCHFICSSVCASINCKNISCNF